MQVNIKLAVVASLLILTTWGEAPAQDQSMDHSRRPYLTTAQPLTILSANDGELRYLHTATGAEQQCVDDSFTVIHLDPKLPPVIRTVAGTVPVTIHGSPHLAITEDGRYGFIANHGWRGGGVVKGTDQVVPKQHLVNMLSAVDLEADCPEVVDQVQLPGDAWMVDLHPDGSKVIVSVGAGFHIYALQERKLKLVASARAPATVFSFDVSPRGNRIIAVTVKANGSLSDAQIHLFQLEGDTITHLHRIEAGKGTGPITEGFSPRISPDGKTAIVLHDYGNGGQGARDDVLIVDLSLKKPKVIQRLAQVGDGLESLAFHPSGRFAVISCLDKGPDVSTTSHLATVDLTTRPARLLNHIPIEPVPEGIEFTEDGTQLFVQATLANHIVVFDVDSEQMTLRRSPYVLCTGHAPSAMAIAPRLQQ